MFLKSLEIFGFKSFADRTRIEFADGISCLLGPNGCGKSNVVDAIKWVVGEQAARSLRAEKMEDVIFNGTETRKPLNVAEVTLTISNELGLLPLDFPEVSIRRRLYRSGESEYSVNNQPAKLKDLRELFWDTGVGKSAYSVMEQGKIDQILSSKPEERRYLFEEAAGITRHKVKCREAELKLEKTEENMRQIEGILGEVRRSHDTLKVQCEKTLLYRKLREDVFQTELEIQLLRLRKFLEDKASRSGDIAAKQKARDQVRGEIDAINQNLEENMDVVNSMEASLVDHQKTIYGLAVERVGKEKQKTLLSERSQEARAKVDACSGRIAAITERLEGLYEDVDEKQAVLRDLEVRMGEVRKNIEGFEESIHASGGRITRNEEAIGKNESDIRDLEISEAGLRTELESITEDIVRELDRRLKESGYSIQDRKRREGEIQDAIARLKVGLSGRTSILEDASRLHDPARDDLKKLVEKTAEAVREALGTVGALEESFSEYRKTTPSFIDEFLSPEGIITKKRGLDARVLDARKAQDGKKAAIAALRDENRDLRAKMEEYRSTLEALRVSSAQMETQAQGGQETVRMIRREITSQETLKRETENEGDLARKKLLEINDDLSLVDSEISEIDRKGSELTKALEKLERDIALRNSDLSGKQEDLKKKMARLGQLQAELERYHLDMAQTETEIRNIKENFREQYSRDLMEFEERMYEIRVPAQELKDAAARKKQELRDLGTVNLMAVEEFQEVKERFDFLSGQLSDLERARDDLNRITAEIRTESTELFLLTYNKIKKNFHNMFRRLFGGGRAELHLVDPDHVLTSGIEIYAQPPGKKLENITLLSGGEKSMTAVGLLFATYMVKPSPFCFLDEIDAALDEANVLRFVQLLMEFGKTSQFVVITHNKKTVTGAQALLGVTMEESGVTKVISVRLANAPGEKPEPIPPPEPCVDEDVIPETGTELPSELELEVERRKQKRLRAEARRLKAERGEAVEPEVEDAPVAVSQPEGHDEDIDDDDDIDDDADDDDIDDDDGEDEEAGDGEGTAAVEAGGSGAEPEKDAE